MGRERRTANRLRVAVYTTLTCFCLLLFQGRTAFGQVDEGAITGTVVDSTGAVIPNAQVTLLNTDQGINTGNQIRRRRGLYVFAGQGRTIPVR